MILPPSSNVFPLKEGSKGLPVNVLQYMLVELSSLYSTLEGVAVTGEYDKATEAAVRELQEKSRLVPSGAVDIPTWNAITDQYNILFSNEPLQ